MPTTDSVSVLLTKDEARTRIRASLTTFNRLLASGKIRKVKLGKKVLIRESDLNAYINGLTDDPTPIRRAL
jgi:excisionase family DNA binding protein